MQYIFRVLLLTLIVCGSVLSPVESRVPGSCTRCQQSQKCVSPDCFCCREELDMPFAHKQLPQIVFFTFDDAVTGQVARFYKQLFDSSRKNPNGCPISMTLFVSHSNTKYDLVRDFYEKGMEIASHSVTHSAMNNTNFYAEAKTQKENLSKLAKIPIEDIKGWRSPYLKPAGDLQPDTLHKLGYLYDATLTFSKRSFREKPPSPFTLDFGWPYECQVRPCPRNKHPGFWEVPVVSLMDYKHEYDCVYVDGCLNAPPDEDAAYKFLWDNFYNYHSNSKIPFGINMHPSWFYYPDRLKAMDRFIRELVKMDDVYIISVGKMINWLKDPVPLSELKAYKPWSCDSGKPGKGDTSQFNRYPARRPIPPPIWQPGAGVQSLNNRRQFLKQNLVPTPPTAARSNRRQGLTAQERHIQLMIQNRRLQNGQAANNVINANRRLPPIQPVQTIWHLRMAPRRQGRVYQNFVSHDSNAWRSRHQGKPYRHNQGNIRAWPPIKPTPTAILAHTERPKQAEPFEDFLQRIQQPAIEGRKALNPVQKTTAFRYTVTPAPTNKWFTRGLPRISLRTQAPKLTTEGRDTLAKALATTTEHPLLKRRRIQLEHMRINDETIAKQRGREERIREKQLADIREQQRNMRLNIRNLAERRKNQQRQVIIETKPRQTFVIQQASPRQRQAWQSFIQLMMSPRRK